MTITNEFTVSGNLTADPELRFTQNGVPVVNFNIAHTPRVKSGDEWTDGETTYFRCTAWRSLAENVAETLKRGDNVLVVGQLKTRKYTNRDNVENLSIEIEASNVGPSLSYATAVVTRRSGNRNARSEGNNQGNNGFSNNAATSGDDPWQSSPQQSQSRAGAPIRDNNFSDEPPF